MSTANLEMNCDLLENMYRRLRTAKTTSRSLDDNRVVKCSIDEYRCLQKETNSMCNNLKITHTVMRFKATTRAILTLKKSVLSGGL